MEAKIIEKILNKYLKKYRPQIDALVLRLQPIREYWVKLSGRDQQVLIGAGALVVLMFIIFTISSALQFSNSLQNDYSNLLEQKIDSEIIASQFKSLSDTTPNDFSTANSDRVKGDATQILDVKDAEIILSNNNLNITAKNAKFEKIMQFLDQLRKSYGLFPSTLTITRTSQSGYANFKAGFTSVEQE